jgi:hypothetical protein
MTDEACLALENPYALPSGEVVNLPAHCRDNAERFALADGSLVWAVRVIAGNLAVARLAAAMMPRPRPKRADAAAPRQGA